MPCPSGDTAAAALRVAAAAVLLGLPAIGAMAAGNDIEQQAKASRSYLTVVRMDDGATREIRETRRPAWRSGDRVRVAKGTLILDIGG